MPMSCKTCGHPDLELIDAALVGNASKRSIAQHFDLSPHSVTRHADHHLPATLSRAADAAETTRADDLLARIDRLESEASGALDRLKADGDDRGVLAAVRELSRIVELLARIRGELPSEVQILIAPEWVTVRAVVIGALSDHPEARTAVVDALEQLDSEGSQ